MDLSNENIIHVKKEEIEYLQFKKLLEYKDIITHGYVIGKDKNFRTAYAEGKLIPKKEYDLAIDSFKKSCNALGIKYNELAKPQQQHTKNVEVIEKKYNQNEPDFAMCKNTDGFITNKNDIVLVTTNADCILLLFFDPVKKIVANVHSGWKGTLQRISVETVKKMKENYGCEPEDIICCMCPSIRKCHFEVDEDVYKLFYNEFKNIPNFENCIETKGNKWHIDTIEINRIILKEQGLKLENIIDSKICSVCNNNLIHSCRAEGEGYGLSAAFISLIK